MSSYSILFLGEGDDAAEYLAELETLSVCSTLHRFAGVAIPDDAPPSIDLIILELGSTVTDHERALGDIIHDLRDYPVLALTDKAHEHRGIAAAKAGADGYIVRDDISVEAQQALFDHVVLRHSLSARLAETDSSVLSILRNINDGVIVVDIVGNILEINPAARGILGLGTRWQPDSGWEETFCCLDGDGLNYRNAGDLPLVRARCGEKFSGQVATYRAPEQPDTLLELNGQGLYDGNGQLLGGVVTFRDVTDDLRRSGELTRRAQYDELTGLPNQQLFIDTLTSAIGRSERSRGALAVLFIDLDRFRSVNEALGHDVGDRVLAEAARRLGKNLRVGDYLGRWGGDKFVVCLEQFGGEAINATAAAQKLLLVLSERFFMDDSELYVAPSIGIAMYPESGSDAEALVRAADIAMCEAKKRGGGRFHHYSSSLGARLEQQEELEIGLRHALVRQEFVLHYQPRIDVASGRVIGFEALLRWQHPRFGLLTPERFLPILESSGLVHSAGEWVIETACRQLAGWQRMFELPDLSIAINISQQQLKHQHLVEVVERTLRNSALDAGCVELEIGEGAVVRGRHGEAETLIGLRKLGVRISLDRFGKHAVSFNTLEDGFIDSFVLDPSLISDVVDNPSHQRIVRAAIAMAQGLDIEVAAECIESERQLEFLKSCNCDQAQGFLISRPVQPDQVAAILRSEIAGTKLLASGMG
jgi:diguanylate cyclase (GGDEF)-like protein